MPSCCAVRGSTDAPSTTACSLLACSFSFCLYGTELCALVKVDRQRLRHLSRAELDRATYAEHTHQPELCPHGMHGNPVVVGRTW